ncbi:hypothetical protein TNCV_3717941, partial [Trichonephila clavipes]
AENREGSLGFPGFVKPVFTKDSKTPREKEKITRHLGSVKPGTTPKKVSPRGGQEFEIIVIGAGVILEHWMRIICMVMMSPHAADTFTAGSPMRKAPP